jgi:hypothetical protein
MANLSKFSEKGQNRGARVDIAALSNRASWKHVQVPVRIATASGVEHAAHFVINTSKDHRLGPVGLAATLKAAMVSSGQVPAGGTLAWQIVAATTDGTTKVALTDTANPEAVTADVGQALVLAATNAERAATDVYFLRCTASNDAVGTDARDVWVSLWFALTEETTLTE